MPSRVWSLLSVLCCLVAAAPSGAAEQRLSGRRLLLREDAANPGKRLVRATSRDAGQTLGGGNGSADDPVLHGATVRVVSDDGRAFDVTDVLPAAGWRYIGAPGANAGYRFESRAPRRSVIIKPGKQIKVSLRASLAHALDVDPGAVAVVLTLGGQRYCLRFGGATAYTADREFSARNAPAAASCPANQAPWPMHVIDDRYRGSNAVSPVDLNGDGLRDYVTNYEFDQRYMVELHPLPPAEDVRAPWPTVTAFALPQQPVGTDTEHAAAADLDGDGNLDIVGAQGWHFTGFFEGQNAGIRVVWGPPVASIGTPAAWVDGGRSPGTVDQGHFLWVVPYDVNGDGLTDVLTGGRVFDPTDTKGSIRWIEAPAPPADRRDLSLWQVHNIDPDQWDGHGFQLDDVDEDGDMDLVDANADFDTPENEETVHWYENPGTGLPAQAGPWTKHVIYQGPEFRAKPQIAVADLDGDGLTDYLTAVDQSIYWFRKTSLAPVAFERIVIPKPAATQWFQRPIRVADFNGDGRLDLLGMLSHDNGNIPGSTLSAFWMEYTGAAPGSDNWITHPIKFGPGTPMFLFSFGEKWDNVDVVDVDGDGDLDIVANCEEWWVDGNGAASELASWWQPTVHPNSVSVVWFENRLDQAPPVCDESGGLCAVEAEHYSDLRDGTWVKRARFAGYAGDGYMANHVGVPAAPTTSAAGQGLRYTLNLQGGTYRIWLRRWVPSTFGGNGGGNSNSAWLAVDGQSLGVVDDLNTGFDAWTWVQAPAPVALAAGPHRLSLEVRERGYAVDRIVVSADAGFTPSGTGPAETLVE
ncbi:MAG: FG-GAP-like repeat-containing protein [Candidatus Binatia bacterium]